MHCLMLVPDGVIWINFASEGIMFIGIEVEFSHDCFMFPV